jgi:hypothetical protein
LRNVNTGQFEVYDIAGNTLVGAASLGTVGLDWQLGGLAVDPPVAAGGAIDGSDDSNAQLVQSMASFGSSAGGQFNSVFPADDLLQQTFMTTPHA